MRDFEAFYRNHLRLVTAMALAHGVTPDQAQDLAQETFYRAWRHFDRLSGMEAPAQRTWLIRTVINLVTDGWRRVRTSELAERPHARPVPALSERVALNLDVAQALASLDETDRQVVVLRYVMEMNSREIGEVLNMPEGTVRSRLHRGRKLLAEQLKAWDPKRDQE